MLVNVSTPQGDALIAQKYFKGQALVPKRVFKRFNGVLHHRTESKDAGPLFRNLYSLAKDAFKVNPSPTAADHVDEDFKVTP